MKKTILLEVYIDENMEDAVDCMNEVVEWAKGHEYCLDGTVEIKVVE